MKQVLLPNGGTVLEKADRISREELTTEPPDSKKAMTEAIDYAIRSNAQEGLYPSPEAMAMLEKVKAGELSLDEYRQIIERKARNLGNTQKVMDWISANFDIKAIRILDCDLFPACKRIVDRNNEEMIVYYDLLTDSVKVMYPEKPLK